MEFFFSSLSLFFLFFFFFFFFFNDTATTEIYTLSLHDALPISAVVPSPRSTGAWLQDCPGNGRLGRSEEHTSELQSRENLVCRLLLEKKKKKNKKTTTNKKKKKKKKQRINTKKK